jgi:catechol 2,3-dioxygenase-like lactoylglutathione lyase family enzyme
MIKNIRHTGLVVKDLEQSIEFYLALGFEVKADNIENKPFIDIISCMDITRLHTIKMIIRHENNNCWVEGMIELLDYGEDTVHIHRLLTANGCAHIAFTVDNLDVIYEQLSTKLNIYFLSGPTITPDKKAKVAFCKAPEGTFIELVEELETY